MEDGRTHDSQLTWVSVLKNTLNVRESDYVRKDDIMGLINRQLSTTRQYRISCIRYISLQSVCVCVFLK